MQAGITITETANNVADLRKAMRALTEQDVYIGVPEEKAQRNGAEETDENTQGITNAYLSYIHEHGVPERGIAARPHLIPGILSIQPEAEKLLEEAAVQAFKGNYRAVNRILNKIGIMGQNAVRALFVNNNWQPLKRATLSRKIGKKTRLERGRINPLMLTNQLLKAHTYVIRRRGAAMEYE